MRLSEMREARAPRPPASAFPAARAPAAGLLRLQRTVGNRALTQLLQRNGRENWSLPVTDERRKAVDAKAPKWAKTGAGSTMHHIVSKEMFEHIVKELQKALASGTDEIKAAARAFDDALTAAAKAAGVERAERAKQTWNLPFNLAAGPGDPANDPGERFDPAFEELVSADGARYFRQTAVSEHLYKLEQAFRKGRRDAAGTPGLTAEAWKAMRVQLEAARKLGGDEAVGFEEGEWLSFKSSAGTQEWVRSGDRRYPGPQLGQALFPNKPEKVPEGKLTPIGGPTIAFTIPRNEKGDPGSTKVYLSLSVTPKAIKHVCQRHTYRYFTGAESDMKAVNTFFRAPLLEIDEIRGLLQAALPKVAAALRIYVEDAAVGSEDLEALMSDRDVSLTGVSTEGGMFYVKAAMEHLTAEYTESEVFKKLAPPPEESPAEGEEAEEEEEDVMAAASSSTRSRRKQRVKQKRQPKVVKEKPKVQAPALPTHGWMVEIKTVAPDGPDSDAYTRDELMTIERARKSKV